MSDKAQLRVVEVDKLCKSEAGLLAAYTAGFPLQQKGWCRYPPACWDRPAVLVFEGGECVAGVNYRHDDDECSVSICFAFCSPTRPRALVMALSRFRAIIPEWCEQVTFDCHPGNRQMEKTVEILGAKPTLRSYSVPVSQFANRA